MGHTLVEKIATRYAVGLNDSQQINQGDIITICPKHIMTHDNTSAVIGKFRGIGATKIHDPKQPVFAIDHDIQNTSPINLGKYALIGQFARQQGVDFHPAGTGISHQVMVEQGYATPGSMIVGSDSHSNIYGGIGALGTPVVRTDAACIWATGETWWRVPAVAKVTLTGILQPGVTGKDVIIVLCGIFNNDEVLNMAVEFVGDGAKSLTLDQRLSIANMSTEWGALAGVFPFDETVRDYLYSRADAFNSRGDIIPKYNRDSIDQWYVNRLEADIDAHYAIELTLDLNTVVPHVSGPDHVKVMRSLPDIESERIKINRAYVLSCVNGRLEDMQEAAAVLKDHKVADGVTLYIAAASAEIQSAAMKDGTWQILIDAGAVMLPPGCGTCIGLGEGTLESGEVGISATNRNFKGRMGARDAKAYLASPAVVAASAIKGYICAPVPYSTDDANAMQYECKTSSSDSAEVNTTVDIIGGFPKHINGRVLWMSVDNLNTDGIYSGVMTYRDDVTPEEMAAVAFENYDPEFQSIANNGDIIVSGKNFGTGSSREQAATCLMARGIQCVIAESFSETYARNAFNNGFMVLVCPDLVTCLRQHNKDIVAPTIAGSDLEIDFYNSTITYESQQFSFNPLSPTAQELIVAKGAENIARRKMGLD